MEYQNEINNIKHNISKMLNMVVSLNIIKRNTKLYENGVV